jgi:hypothetical protein
MSTVSRALVLCGAVGHVMTIAISFMGGVLLGLRWSYSVLFPTLLLVGPTMFSLGGMNWTTVGQVVVAMTAIQLGYLSGVAVRSIGASQTTTGKLRGTIQRH